MTEPAPHLPHLPLLPPAEPYDVMRFLSISLALAVAPLVIAAEPVVKSVAARAYLITGPNEFQEAWITAADNAAVTYRDTEKAGETRKLERAKIGSIYFFEPTALTEAMALYRGRKYLEAKERFATIKDAYAPLQNLPENPSTLAAFHELECLRNLDDLTGLAKALEGFHKGGLVQEHQIRQIEIYVFWNAVRTKSWERLNSLAEGRRDEKLPGYQRAQIAYCQGLALENLGRLGEALDLYQVAITADGGASSSLACQSALSALRIYKADPSVQVAIRRWGSADESLDATGRRRLMEAASLARMVEGVLGSGRPLPGEFRDFLKYSPPATAAK